MKKCSKVVWLNRYVNGFRQAGACNRPVRTVYLNSRLNLEIYRCVKHKVRVMDCDEKTICIFEYKKDNKETWSGVDE